MIVRDSRARGSQDGGPVKNTLELLDRFEIAWQGGTTPRIEEFLTSLDPIGEGSPEDVSQSTLLEELVKIDLEY